MSRQLLRDLLHKLPDSDAAIRKQFAEQIITEEVPLDSLLSILHSDDKTAQRFMWLIGDICRISPETVAPCVPFLFSVRHELSFPGVNRGIAVSLFQTGIPKEIEHEAIVQIFQWMEDKETSIACKSFSAKCLHLLLNQERVGRSEVIESLRIQQANPNQAFRSRMSKILAKIESGSS